MPRYDDPTIFYDDPAVFYDAQPSPHKMPAKKNTLPVDDVIGFATQAKMMLNTYKTAMIAKGVDPTTLMGTLDTECADLATKNQNQEATKTLLRQKTELTDAAKDLVYRNASLGCDMVIGCYGRTSQEGREATNLRKSIRPRNGGGSPPPPPNP